MPTRKTPGVYVEEISNNTLSIAQIETAIPAFIGFTEFAKKDLEDDLLHLPFKISSMLDFERHFGLPKKETILNIKITDNKITVLGPNENQKSPFLMHYSLQLYFANGGGDCYVVCAGQYGENRSDVAQSIELLGLQKALTALEQEDEPSLIVFPDATLLPIDSQYYSLLNSALKQCNELGDRFVIIDTYRDKKYDNKSPIEALRNGINLDTEYLKNGAAYFPFLETSSNYQYNEELIEIEGTSPTLVTLADLSVSNPILYNEIKLEIALVPIILPPSSIIAGIYARVDKAVGVWKAPANVVVENVIKPTIQISNKEQDELNIDVLTGKSINAIRTFTGKGTLVWGARTLAGNDNEWKYVPVRRLFIAIEESIKKALNPFVFEPNNNNTWFQVKTMIDNYLSDLWRSGALAGAKPEHAFYVQLGLGKTMTAQDVLEGRMIIEIGMAVVRPAEFIILKISQKMQVD